MFGRRKQSHELDPPPVSRSHSNSVEILRVWEVPGGPVQVTLRTSGEDPGTWGLLLVDVARHAAQAYEREGLDHDHALQRIRQLFDAEWASPTSPAEDLTDEV